MDPTEEQVASILPGLLQVIGRTKVRHFGHFKDASSYCKSISQYLSLMYQLHSLVHYRMQFIRAAEIGRSHRCKRSVMWFNGSFIEESIGIAGMILKNC